MNQTQYDQLHKKVDSLAIYGLTIINEDDLKALEDLWNSYLRVSTRCERLEKELYALRDSKPEWLSGKATAS